MKTTVNGETFDLPAGATVATLLELLGAAKTGVAVARNERVVPRARFGADEIAEGDRIEIIRAVAGG